MNKVLWVEEDNKNYSESYLEIKKSTELLEPFLEDRT